MDHFLSNIFPWRKREVASPPPATHPARKRNRTPELHQEEQEAVRPIKLFRSSTRKVAVRPEPSIDVLPEDLLKHCLSFVGGMEDRCALQTTNKQFQKITNCSDFLRSVEVSNIILDSDTPESACEKLKKYAAAGNPEALYMLGIIKSYCTNDVKSGVVYLESASKCGYVRALYALGLVLGDSEPKAAALYMKEAARLNYLPALQEIMSVGDLKARCGEPDAKELRGYLDQCCLNRLLSRHYCESKELRALNTSHCWNPLCGRWAFKSTVKIRNHVSRMKMCSRCCRAKYCSKLCQVYDWRSGRHKMECQFL